MNLFLAHGNKNWPSSRIRAWSIAEHWDDAECYLYQDAKHLDLGSYDNIILQKILVHEALELAKKYNVYLDLCDPDWWDKDIESLLRAYLSLIKGVVTSSESLKNDFEQTFNVIPTWINDRFPPEIKVREHCETIPVLVWFGMVGNRAPCLNPIGLTLQRLINNEVKFKLLIIDSEPGTKYLPWSYHEKWTRDTIHDVLCRCDVALLPQLPGPWGLVKSDNKKATAQWAGLPVHDGLDYFTLRDLLVDANLRAETGDINRETAELCFDIKSSVSQWKELIASEIPAEVA